MHISPVTVFLMFLSYDYIIAIWSQYTYLRYSISVLVMTEYLSPEFMLLGKCHCLILEDDT